MSLSPNPIRLIECVNHNPRHHEDEQRKKTLKEIIVKEKCFGSSFLVVHAYNSHREWLILFFGIESNMFKLLCIEVIFIYNIQLLVDDWYYHFILKASNCS